MKLRQISLVLLCSLLAACGEQAAQTQASVTDAQAQEGDAAVAETEEEARYELPGLDFEGREFAMLVATNYCQSLVPEENGEVLNDAKYAMGRTVEEALHVKIRETDIDLYSIVAQAQSLVMAGDTSYNSIAMMDRFAIESAKKGYYVPLQKISSISLSKPYWGGKLSDQLSIGKNYFFAVSAMNLRTLRTTACVLMNTRLAAAYGLTVPYDDVMDGSWTFEKMTSAGEIACADVNGDGVMDAGDSYTYVPGDIRRIQTQMLIGFGTRCLEKDDSDIPYLALYGNERYIDQIAKIHDLFLSGANDLSNALSYDTFSANGLIFQEGRALYNICEFQHIEALREMQDDFAVLVMPKYDDSQAEYHSRTFDATYHMVPVTEADPEFAGAVLDALSCVGYHDMVPVFLETVLKDKLSRDERSKECIQLAFDTRMIDLGESLLYDKIMGTDVYKRLTKSADQAVSMLEKSRKSSEKTLEKLITAFTGDLA